MPADNYAKIKVFFGGNADVSQMAVHARKYIYLHIRWYH